MVVVVVVAEERIRGGRGGGEGASFASHLSWHPAAPPLTCLALQSSTAPRILPASPSPLPPTSPPPSPLNQASPCTLYLSPV